MKHLFLLVLILLVVKLAGSLYAQRLISIPTRTISWPVLNELPSDDSLGQQEVTIKTSPRKATIRSLLLPGLGQIYNNQAWKLAFIYSGAGVAIYLFKVNQKLYRQYSAGYREAYNLVTTSAKTAVVNGRILSVQQLKRATDQYQQQRDLTVILTVVGWALNVVEANVAAHLKSFDLSDDLSMHIAPALRPSMGIGFAPGIRVLISKR